MIKEMNILSILILTHCKNVKKNLVCNRSICPGVKPVSSWIALFSNKINSDHVHCPDCPSFIAMSLDFEIFQEVLFV